MSPAWIKASSQEYWDKMSQIKKIHYGSSFLVSKECATLKEPTFQGYTEIDGEFFKTVEPVTVEDFKNLHAQIIMDYIKLDFLEYKEPLEKESEWFSCIKYSRELVNH